MPLHRPLLISVMQFEDDLKQGRRTVFDVIETAQRLGADGIELRRETWPRWQEELAAARQRIEQHDLLVTYATMSTLFATEEEGLQALRADIDAAHALGAPQVRFFPGHVPAPDEDARWQTAQEIVEYAADREVTIALENYARTPGGTLAEIQTALNRIQNSALMTNIDIGNYWLHGQDVPAAIGAVGQRAVSAHIKDQEADRSAPPAPLGTGVLPLPAIFAELDALPQPLIYCFEFRGGEDPESRIEQALTMLRNR